MGSWDTALHKDGQLNKFLSKILADLLIMKLEILSIFCVALSPSLVCGLVFDPFRSFLLGLKESIGNSTHEQDGAANQTWIDSFHKIISDTSISDTTTTTTTTTSAPTTKDEVSAVGAKVVTIPSITQSGAVSQLKEKLDNFVSVAMEPDYKFLTETEKRVMVDLIKAAALMDPIYERQVWTENPRRMEELAVAGTSLSKLQLEYMYIMGGPWDRYNEDKPFAIDREKPAGGGFYPEDMTEKQFQFYVASNPDKRESLESPLTVIQQETQPAVLHLREAANQTESQSFKKFLNSRSLAFETNDYSESDKDWLAVDARVHTAIGPYRVVDDTLKGLKKSFEAIVYILEQSFKPQFRTLLPETETEYAELIPELEADLPVPEEVKNKEPSKTSIQVAELVFA